MSSGCGCKEVYIYRFLHNITYPYILPSCIRSFAAAASLLFVHLTKKFFVLVPVHFCNLLNNFSVQYKQTYGRLRVSHGSHMKDCT